MASNDSKKLSGKVALITGGSRGIGRAIAGAYADQGAEVFICGRNPRDLTRAIEEIRLAGGVIDGASGDIAEPADVQRIVQQAVARFGTIDVLVNNASLLGPRVTIADL